MELEDLSGTWDQMWVWRPAGTHFGADGSSPLAFSDVGNKLAGQARLGPLVDRAEDALTDDAARIAVGALVGIGGTVLAMKYVMPQVRKLRNRLQGTKRGDATELVVLDAVRVRDFADSVDTTLAELSPEMTSEEAQRRLLNIMLAAASIAENLRALRESRIQEDEASHELAAAVRQLSASKVADSINRMLESDATLLSEKDSLAFVRAFGGGQIHEGVYIPVTREQVKEALRLPE